MIDHIEFEITPIEEATDAIKEWIVNYFLTDLNEQFIDLSIEAEIDNYLAEFKDDTYCLLEFPYVDKVYRDSYYSYYSSKHYTYHRDCIRISIFNSAISKEDFITPENHKKLQAKYLGYFIIRPTTNAIFGRSIISVRALINDNIKICKCKSEALVFGVKLSADGFPHSSQDGESIKCAETTIWGIMEYFGTRYSEYKPVLPTSIRKSLERFSYQRQLPSNGLTMDQISFALKDFGFGTRIYSKDTFQNDLFKIIDIYVESGIPVLAGLESENLGHVIIIIGKEYPDLIEWNNIVKRSYKGFNRDVTYYDAADLKAKYVVQDDNHVPYKVINLESPGEHYEEDEEQQYKIESIVVPLYPKIYLEAVVANELLIQILKDERIGYDFGDDFIFRTFLTSSRSFKQHISKLNQMDNILKYNIITARMPKFIWCAEVYVKSSFNSKIACGLVILDATEANQESIDAFIFAGYPDKCIGMNENNYISLQFEFKNYMYYCNLT